MRLIVFVLCILFSSQSYGGVRLDSVVISSHCQLKNLEDVEVRVLVIDFKVKRDHLFLNWPKKVEKLYILNESSSIIITENLFLSFNDLRFLKIKGEAVSCLPEFLHFCDSLKVIELVECDFHDIWKSGSITSSNSLDSLILRDVEVDVPLRYYKEMFFLSKQVHFNKIVIYDDEVKVVEKDLVCKVFNCDELVTMAVSSGLQTANKDGD